MPAADAVVSVRGAPRGGDASAGRRVDASTRTVAPDQHREADRTGGVRRSHPCVRAQPGAGAGDGGVAGARGVDPASAGGTVDAGACAVGGRDPVAGVAARRQLGRGGRHDEVVRGLGSAGEPPPGGRKPVLAPGTGVGWAILYDGSVAGVVVDVGVVGGRGGLAGAFRVARLRVPAGTRPEGAGGGIPGAIPGADGIAGVAGEAARTPTEHGSGGEGGRLNPFGSFQFPDSRPQIGTRTGWRCPHHLWRGIWPATRTSPPRSW